MRFKGLNNVAVTPRTTESQLNIITDLENYTIDIFNTSGQVVKSYKAMSLDQTISIETLISGLYYIKINGGSENQTLKIIKI
ncbi:MAG: T9SS type A sorting domain-containing protein [Saprospiraceae bacterium]|nr:T9SS type A sorting domain-containing protein [Saprospiraceae bacterium]